MTDQEAGALWVVVLRESRRVLMAMGASGVANSPEDVAVEAVISLLRYRRVSRGLVRRVVRCRAVDWVRWARPGSRSAHPPTLSALDERTGPVSDWRIRGARDRLADVRRATHLLTRTEREIVSRLLGGASHSEVAKALRLALVTQDGHLSRARAKLRAAMFAQER